MNFKTSIDIAASRERVWEVLADVERWPEWTASMRRVRYVSGDQLTVGSKIGIEQPRLPALIWEVTDVRPQESFTWMTRSSGLTILASHQVSDGPSGGVTVTLGIEQRGALGWLIGPLMGRTNRRYLRMEAAGLKQRCERPA